LELKLISFQEVPAKCWAMVEGYDHLIYPQKKKPEGAREKKRVAN
jgi:hypothetical protein